MDRITVLKADVAGITRELGRAKEHGHGEYADILRSRRADLLQEILLESGERGFVTVSGAVDYTDNPTPRAASAKKAIFGPAFSG